MDEHVDPSNQQTYASLLADAVRVFTDAARLGRPVSGRVGKERGEPVDWAEFVTLALAGAAANIGHVEAVLAGRPGSWEAEGARQLLISTVATPTVSSLRHRTEPVAINVYVDELLPMRAPGPPTTRRARSSADGRWRCALTPPSP